MAGVSLTLRYQWRAFWRQIVRRRRIQFYLTVLALGGGFIVFALPALLSRASGELAAGQDAPMTQLLMWLCLLWLAVLGESRDVSLSSERLRRFPLDVRSLIAIRVLSMYVSPIVWMVMFVSLLCLFPFLSAPHPLLGSLCAVILCALTIGLGMSISALVAARSMAAFVVAASALGIAAANPAALATTAATATSPFEMAMPFGTLTLAGAGVWSLLRWSFPRSLDVSVTRRRARRSTRVARLPGRLGPLVEKEYRSALRIPDLWMGLLPVLAGTALSLSPLGSSTLRLWVIALVCALNLNVTSNCLGLERPAGLARYLIFPIRGRELLLANNAGRAAALAVQLALLMAVGAWKGSPAELGSEVMVAGVSLLGHFAWGNIVSVFEPRRAEPYRFAQGPDPITALVSAVFGGTQGVAVIVLLRSDSPLAALAIAAIVLFTMACYYGSLRIAGASFERRIEIISRRLA
jgi:hypothetical protein